MVISVSLGAQSYPILLEAGALARAGSICPWPDGCWW